MTFKELAAQLSKLQGYTSTENQNLLCRLRNKPFWIWDEQEHDRKYAENKGNCCFNDIVQRPTKNGRQYPLFDYEKTIFDILFPQKTFANYSAKSLADLKNVFEIKDKHLYILKSTGLGISEFFLRLIAWLCTRNDDFRNAQVVIVTGPNIDLAIGLIRRLKRIFEPKLGIRFDDKETVLNLNGCHIQAFPSNHIDSFRSLDNPKFILLDESDMFRLSDQPEVRHVSERYIAKSNPYIVLCSTPGAPGQLMEQISKEPEDSCIYHRLRMDWTYGLGKIYTSEEITAQKASPSWEREYCLKFGGALGNVFLSSQIDRALELGDLYSLDKIPINPYCIHSIGVDPGFSSSATAIVATEFLKEESKIRIIYAEQFEKSDPQYLVNLIFNLYHKYGHLNTSIYVDGSNRAFVNLLKVAFNESLNWEKSMIKPNPNNMNIIPVSFNSEHKEMLSHLAMLVGKEYLCLPSQFDKMEIALRSAYADEYSLNKERSSYNDLTDALRLACKQYKMK